MLHFLRKHQKYFFFVITVVVIASFSFFGTYDTLAGNSIHEQVAFTAIDGSEVSRGDLDAMVMFISTDNDDKKLYGGAWGPNFFNDGVVKKDILATGLGEILAASYPNLVGQELASRLEKERRYAFYSHPQAKFLSVESAWDYFAPEMKTHLRTIRKADDALESKAFAARVALYLNERRFPPALLRQVLRYQQQQQNWISPDPNLDHIDLSLFGYHTLDDWFGARFLRVIAEFIINSGKIALQKGYSVSRDEALASLLKNTETSFQQNLNSPSLGVSNSTEYMNEQLRLLGIDRTKAVKVWQQVLLFRRLFQDVGNAIVTDALAPQLFTSYAQENITGDLYRLPSELHLRNYESLQKLETYLYAVAKRPRIDKMNGEEMLSLPTVFLSVDEVKKKYPELVQKRYELEISQVNKNTLQSKISLKDTWNWEADAGNWKKLKEEFPDLGVREANSREERIAALDSLDDRTRSRVDAFARSKIVNDHVEWLDIALKEGPAKRMVVGISQKGGRGVFAAVDNREKLIELLDKAPLNEDPVGDLARFSGNDTMYFRIKVLEKYPQEEILTFVEADREGVLDPLVEQTLESQYVKMREINPTGFQKEDKSWKPFADVRDLIADQYFEKLHKAIQVAANEDKILTGDRSASLRFYAYMKKAQSQLKKAEDDASSLVRKDGEKNASLADQWKLEKIHFSTNRSDENSHIDTTEMFTLTSQEWTDIHAPVNGDIYFFQLKERGNSNEELTASNDEIFQAHKMLSGDAQRNLMYQVVHMLKEKNAISLEYLNRGDDIIESEEQPNN